MKIRELEKEEYQDAVNLARECFLENKSYGLSHEDASKYLNALGSNEDLEYIGCYEGDLRGAVGYQKETFAIAVIAVRKEDQKKGIGGSLLKQLTVKAEKEGTERITALVFPRMSEAFSKLGFERYKENIKRKNMTLIPMEYLAGKENLGRTVHVTIERSLGSYDPQYPDTECTVNCGYVDESTADGEFQDAYVYGPKEPVDYFTGRVIAIIYHADGHRSRWVVSDQETFDKQDVINAVAFEEQHFDTRFLWLEKK